MAPAAYHVAKLMMPFSTLPRKLMNEEDVVSDEGIDEEEMSLLLMGYLTTFAFGLIMAYYVFHIWKVTWFPEAGVSIFVGIAASGFVTFFTDIPFMSVSARDRGVSCALAAR